MAGADVQHRAVEAQPLAGKLMVAVEHRLAVGDAGDAPHDFVAVLFGDEMAADATSGGRSATGSMRIILASYSPNASSGSSVTEMESPTFLPLSASSIFGKDAGMPAVQIDDRLWRFLDQLVVRIEQLEGNGDDGVGEDVHRRTRGVGLVGAAATYHAHASGTRL